MVRFWVLVWDDSMYKSTIIGIFSTKEKAAKERDVIIEKEEIDPDEMLIKERELDKVYLEED